MSFVHITDGGARLGVTTRVFLSEHQLAKNFANGPHIATQIFEIGDVNLAEESAIGIGVFASVDLGNAQLGASVYHQTFEDFIYLSGTGLEEDELPVFGTQQDASFFGFEADMVLPLISRDSYSLTADLRASYVSADLDDGSNVPRMPPVSIYAALDTEFELFDVRTEIQWFGKTKIILLNLKLKQTILLWLI